MIVGVPTEIKPDERRVALTPAGAAAFRSRGHRVLVQTGAGAGSGFSDSEYRNAGAQIMRSAAAVWERARMVLKVKEPQRSEFRFLRGDLVLFTYLHLAAEPALARELVRHGTAALGYETVQLEDQSLPLLAPMSEVAGRLAVPHRETQVRIHFDRSRLLSRRYKSSSRIAYNDEGPVTISPIQVHRRPPILRAPYLHHPLGLFRS